MEAKCVLCGKPAKYISIKYTSPLCEECAKAEAIKIGTQHGIRADHIEVEDYYSEPCDEMVIEQKSLSLNDEIEIAG